MIFGMLEMILSDLLKSLVTTQFSMKEVMSRTDDKSHLSSTAIVKSVTAMF